MNKMRQISATYGKPFNEVLQDYGSRGFSIAETARTIGIDYSYLKVLVRQRQLRNLFPQQKSELNARCRGVGAHADRNLVARWKKPITVNGRTYYPGEPTYHYIKAQEKGAP